MREGTRRERRSGSRRARERSAEEKVGKFLFLREQGATRGAIAAKLGLSVEGIDELIAIDERGKGEGSR